MSLMKTLAKVAIGVAIAKGAGHLAGRGRTGGGSASSGPGGGLDDLLGQVLGGAAGPSGAPAAPRDPGGGLGGMLEGLSKASRPGGSAPDRGASGGLDDLLGGLASRAGTGAGAGGLGGLIGALAAGKSGSAGGGGFGDLLNKALAGDDAAADTTPDQEAAAGLMIEAMIMAAKSDGKIDSAEEEKLLGHLGDVSAQERAFVQEALRQPVDAGALARDVPRGLEPQIYAMSVLGIDLDHQSEAHFLHSLAQALGMDPQTVNDIHDQMGAPKLYG